jgi:cell filamentation protein
MRDPYIYENGILVNKFRCETKDELDEQEKWFTTSRIIEITEKPIVGNFDLIHLQKIHAYIFQDVYAWAGELRTVTITKGNTMFCPVENINSYSKTIFKQLKEANYLKQLNTEAFCQQGAYYLGEVNMIHPFREGNGRSQRLFFQYLAKKAGYELNFKDITAKQMQKASIRSAAIDNKGFYEIFKKAIAPKK